MKKLTAILKSYFADRNIDFAGVRKFFSSRWLFFISVLTLSWCFRFTAELWAFDNSCFRGMDAVWAILSSPGNYLKLIQVWIFWSGIYALALWLLPLKAQLPLLTVFMGIELLLGVTDCYMVIRYSCPMKDMIVILRATDQQEIREYFTAMFYQGSSVVQILLLLLTLLVSGGIFWGVYKTKAPDNRSLAMIIFLICGTVTWLFPGEDPLRDHPDPIWNFAVNMNTRDHFLSAAANTVAAPKLPPEIKDVLKNSSAPVLGIVIIGESDSRTHHSLYGYGKNSDFFLAPYMADGMICFTDAVSATASTMHSIYFMLTNARILKKYTSPDYGVCEYFHHAGAQISLHDMQRSHGAWSSVLALLFTNADKKRSYSDDGKNHYDGEMLSPVCREIAAAGDGAQLLFVHLMGSHYDQNFRVPAAWRGEFAHLLKDMDAYDRSIMYTDFIISRIYAAAAAQGRPAFVLYIPDHSEEPVSRRSMTTPAAVYYEIPMLLYFNSAYRNSYPETAALARRAAAKPFQTDLALPLIARLMQIPERMIPPEEDILSNAYRPPRRVVAWGEEDYVPSKPEPVPPQ